MDTLTIMFGPAVSALAFVAALALNLLMVARAWPRLMAALGGPGRIVAGGQPPADHASLVFERARHGVSGTVIALRPRRAAPAREGWGRPGLMPHRRAA